MRSRRQRCASLRAREACSTLVRVVPFSPPFNSVAVTRWTQLASMSEARSAHASAAVGGKLYVFGGHGASNGRLSTAEEYDPASNNWAQASSLTSARHSLVAVAL